jgi:hypothetical protein
MDNWAFTNEDNLTYPEDGFAESNFVQTPVPAAIWLLGSGFLGLIGFRRKMKK